MLSVSKYFDFGNVLWVLVKDARWHNNSLKHWRIRINTK